MSYEWQNRQSWIDLSSVDLVCYEDTASSLGHNNMTSWAGGDAYRSRETLKAFNRVLETIRPDTTNGCIPEKGRKRRVGHP